MVDNTLDWLFKAEPKEPLPVLPYIQYATIHIAPAQNSKGIDELTIRLEMRVALRR